MDRLKITKVFLLLALINISVSSQPIQPTDYGFLFNLGQALVEYLLELAKKGLNDSEDQKSGKY